jgi:3'-phosphoadenosine 5'-phosphosulfate sulfotransferase (PAPS reductase)/FAD synthetase
MLRENQRTAGVSYETLDGEVVHLPTKGGKFTTRRKFPQVSADLKVRWCSAYLKIDVARRVLANDPRFTKKNILMLTGERREESACRARYAEIEKHASTSSRKNLGRRVDQWRPVIDWTEQQVWDKMREWRIRPHPAYYLGWGRVSCLACIFGNRDQWASVRKIAPERFERIAQYEREFGLTIKRKESVVEQADGGQAYENTLNPAMVGYAMNGHQPTVLVPEGEEWELPSGAYKKDGGPS